MPLDQWICFGTRFDQQTWGNDPDCVEFSPIKKKTTKDPVHNSQEKNKPQTSQPTILLDSVLMFC